MERGKEERDTMTDDSHHPVEDMTTEAEVVDTTIEEEEGVSATADECQAPQTRSESLRRMIPAVQDTCIPWMCGYTLTKCNTS